jgi:hypothetical protein
MIFPKSGRIVIVDDKIEEAQLVMESLSKTGISYTYLQGNPLHLPDEKDLVDLRILILDLNLDSEAIARTESAQKDFQSRMYALLKRIIRPRAVYLLVVWGKEEDEYYKYIEQLFEDVLQDRRPFRTFSLEKAKYFDLNGSRKDESPDPVKEISEKIELELKNTPSYQLFAEWENCVHQATNATIFSFNDLIADKTKYEEEASAIVASLSRAYLGNQFSKVSREERKLEAAMLALNELFCDSLESILLAENSIQARPDLPLFLQSSQYRARVNTQILISNDVSDKLYPGVVYHNDSDTPFKSILSDAFNRQEIKLNLFTFDNTESLVGEALERAEKIAFSKFERQFRQEQFDRCTCLELHITPLCDYAQDKVRCARILMGLLIPSELVNYLNHKSEYLYVSEFPFEHSGKDYHLLLDFRYFHSVSPSSLMKRNAIFRIRHQWVVDIQSRLSRHVNRPGILYL